VPGGGGARGGQGGQGANLATAPTLQQLAQSILDPNAVVTPQNRYVVLKMKDGKTVTGKLLSVDTFAYQIFDSTEKLQNVSKENIREATMASPMPAYRDKLSTQELSDVISYLTSLKGQ
jgi:putative heme-binding domain-containing protein